MISKQKIKIYFNFRNYSNIKLKFEFKLYKNYKELIDIKLPNRSFKR